MSARARHSTAAPGSSAQARAAGPAVLPEYEPPTFPLNPEAQRSIANLLRKHDVHKLEDVIVQVQSELTTTGASLYDKLYEHEDQLKRRQRKQTEATQTEKFTAFEQQVKEMREKVEGMAGRMEKEMRALVDCSVSAKAMRDAVVAAEADAKANASTQASTQHTQTQRPRRRENNNEEEEEDDGGEEDEEIPWNPTDPAGASQRAPRDVFDTHVRNARDRHQAQSQYERYAETDAYVKWKKLIHDAQTGGDEDNPLPDPSEWFVEAGAPPPGTQRNNNADELDDDISLIRTKISIKCPLTLQEFKDPLSSTKCRHHFESHAILQLINASTTRPKATQCPVSGCNCLLEKGDLHRDELLIRQVRRIQRANRLREERGDDSDSDMENGAQRRGHVIDDDDDDGVNIDEMNEDNTQRAQTQQVKPEPEATGSTPQREPTQPPGGTQVIDLDSDNEDEDDEDEVAAADMMED